MKYAPEDCRRHQTKVEEQRLLGGAAWPHHQAAQPPIERYGHELLEHSSTTSKGRIYTIASSWFDPKADVPSSGL
jgi:hypothetical protein